MSSIKNYAVDVFDLAVHFGLKLLPPDLCSRAGIVIGHQVKMRFYKAAEQRALRTIAKLRPELNEAQIQDLYLRNCEAQCRTMAELSHVNNTRVLEGRLKDFGLAGVQEAAAKGPIILVGCHLGNWELGTGVVRRYGVDPYAVHVPPTGRARSWIAQRVREKTGLRFIPPGKYGVRDMLAVLRDGGAISMFCDEAVKGKIRGPLFGRKPHTEGNLAVAVRLARKTGATICPWYNIRTKDFRFEFHALPPLVLPPEAKSGERLLDDIQLLNDAFEPYIRQHLDQWYFLDSSIVEE